MIKITRTILLWLAGICLLRADQVTASVPDQPDVSAGIDDSGQDIFVEGKGEDFSIPGNDPAPDELDTIDDATNDIVQDHEIRPPTVY